MRSLFSLLIMSCMAVTLIAQAPVQGGEVRLQFKTLRKPIYDLPTHTWKSVGTGIDVGARLGQPIAVQVKGTQLLVDGNGDGGFELRVEGTKPRTMTLTGKAGHPLRYAISLVDKGGWKFRSACCLVAKVGDETIRFFDQNSNGHFDDYGIDAVVVGRSRTACFLSRILSIEGSLYEIELDDQGERLSYSPYKGEVGTLAVSVATKAKVLGAVIRSEDGKYSFELSRMASPIRLPVANYELYSGTIGLGANRVKVKEGTYPAINVQEGVHSDINWGGPVRADFTYLRAGKELQLSPKTIRYYGKSGEEYYSWYPDGKSPRIVIDNGKTGRQIAEAYFPGTC